MMTQLEARVGPHGSDAQGQRDAQDHHYEATHPFFHDFCAEVATVSAVPLIGSD